MSAAELVDALCDILEGADSRSRASAILPLLRGSVNATWQALKVTRPELVAEFAGIDTRTHTEPRNVDQELDRVFATLTALSETGRDPPTTADLCGSFLNDLLAFTNSVIEVEHDDDRAEISEREPVLAVWQAAGVLHDLLEDLRGGDDFVTEPFPFPMAEVIVEWPAPDPRRTALIRAAMESLRDAQVRS